MAQTRFIGPEAAVAEVLCVVIHGRGQTQDDMEQSIVRRLVAPQVRFVLPKSDGPGWYAARAIDPLTAQTRAELAASLLLVGDVIATARAEVPGKPMMILGFSQGACMAVEHLMAQGAEGVAAAALLTGCRVGHRSDAPGLAALVGLPVYATCGDNDPWIPAADHFDMLGDLTRAGARLRADMFPGRPHEVSAVEIAVVQAMIDDLTAGRAVFGGAS